MILKRNSESSTKAPQDFARLARKYCIKCLMVHKSSASSTHLRIYLTFLLAISRLNHLIYVSVLVKRIAPIK